ncbi:A24 family peptidase [Sphingobium sp. AS12]|uniref:prepilin peptidase n=1 Tax=Sphingobium sp. AS12 TaxID=2849495 RepID=UPI001C31CEC3|nr:A24 family peptidase [Sphingobium sp. AS12]MBV2150065.1 A24 family peptidase [Sphingobium sp. AS12]
MLNLSPDMIWIAAGGLLGALIGSFIATAIERWRTVRPIILDRSRCDGCARRLEPFELVPLLSAAALRFRCRTCHAPIKSIHSLIEAAACLIGLLAGVAAPGVHAIAGALLGWQLLALAALDIRHFLLPNALTAGLAITGLVASIAGLGPAPIDSLIGGLAGFGSLWAVKEIYRLIRGREGLGGGDPKLLGGIGCWLGWQALPYILLGASLLALAIAAICLSRDPAFTTERPLPLGAYLALTAFPAWLTIPAMG